MIPASDIAQLSDITGGKIIGRPQRGIRILSTDSRSLPHTDGVMFVAINGERHNGNLYIKDVYKKGVRSFMVDAMPDISQFPEAGFCVVEDSMEALHKIASSRRKDFKGTVIGITGSNGKTIVKEWLYQILQEAYRVIRSPRSFNSQLGVPLSIWPINNQYSHAILEAGISKPGEMSKLERMIVPQIGVLTNLGPAHSENFKSETEKLKEKLLLFRNTEKLIFRSDEEIDGKQIDNYLSDLAAEKISWSLSGDAKYIFTQASGREDQLQLRQHGREGVVKFTLTLSDDASVENICHVIVCLLELGLDTNLIQKGIAALEPVEMRLQILKGIRGTTLVNDVYNSDLAGLNSALDVLMQQKNHKKRAVILSDLFQSGLQEEELYKEVSGLIAFKKIDRFYGIGEAISRNKHLFPDGSKFYSDTAAFLSEFEQAEIEKYALLVKGARNFQFERIVEGLQLQVHQTILEIDVNAMIDNLNYYKSIVSQDTKIMVMVKALSYGSGSYEIAGLLQHEQVDYLAVAFADEGIKLRKAGVKLPIMVMNASSNDYQQLINNDLEPVLFSSQGVDSFIAVCSFNGKEHYPVHIEVETGMHRLGFSAEEAAGVKDKLKAKELRLISIFSHLAGSDEEELDDFSRQQADLFGTISDELTSGLTYPVLRHILNSAGVERFPEYRMDMVRIGIGLYGQGVGKKLKPVSTFKTVISQVEEIGKGETVGYSRSGKLGRDSRIAVIPVGYADGIDRRLGNGNISFHVNGKPTPTVGNICMDMCMIDVTDTDATVGDTVELFGRACTVSDVAKKLETIPYEILTGIPERVKRVYIRE